MATQSNIDAQGYHLEVLGTCMTNNRAGSQHTQTVEAKHLWSYAQEEALIAVSEQGPDHCWRLITDPERRAKRIAARYADLYFKSIERSNGQLQMHWPALAAFVVKDIVEAFRYSREEVLNGGWRTWLRTSAVPASLSEIAFHASPYEHSQRVYTALAKGNLWLFMDIYPWLWYVLEYGLNPDGTLNASRMLDHMEKRDTATLQQQSKEAVHELPFSANWLNRLKGRIAKDPVYAEASKFFQTPPIWAGEDAYGQHQGKAIQAHSYVKQHVKEYDNGYRFPPSKRWAQFDEGFYVMEEERKELTRVANDTAAISRLNGVAQFKATASVRRAYALMVKEFSAKKAEKGPSRIEALTAIANQEQLMILQPLIYEDKKLQGTMDANHLISRWSNGALSPRYAVVYSFEPKTNKPELESVFDAPTGVADYLTGRKASLPNEVDRMEYVREIADKFNGLMAENLPYMEGELKKIRGWLHA